MRKFSLVLALVLCLLLAAGCGAAAPAPTPEPTPSPTPVPTPEPTPAPVELFGRSYDPVSTTELDLQGESGSVAELCAALEQFEALEFVDLRGWTLTQEEMFTLHDSFPDTVFGWELEIMGVPVSSMDEFLSLDNIKMEDVSPVESVLPLLYNMKQIDMCNCGIKDEPMYEFNQRWENVRIVWMSSLGGYPMRTDAIHFLRNQSGVNMTLITSEILDVQLRYFPDLIALDIGHGGIHIKDLSFLRHVPKLQILIIAITHVTDVTPVAQLQDLVFLEIQQCYRFADVTPLAALKNLKDLNISHTIVSDITALAECDSLERLWILSCHNIPDEEVEEFAKLRPDVEIGKGYFDGATELGWHVHERYYWVWDTLHPGWPYPRPQKNDE